VLFDAAHAAFSLHFAADVLMLAVDMMRRAMMRRALRRCLLMPVLHIMPRF